jgi:Fe-S-cluster containining protein
MSNRQRDIRLAKLYAKVPHIDCRGKCASFCGPIRCSTRERNRMERAGGQPLGTQPATAVLPTGERQSVRLCSMLTGAGTCSVYDQRPMICRLWGVVENMRCPHGCQPDRYLTVQQGKDLLAQANETGGPPDTSDVRWDPNVAVAMAGRQ